MILSHPASFCCIVTKNSCIECFSMLLSLAHKHKNANIGILCDTFSFEYIKKSNPNIQDLLQIEFIVNLDKYSEHNRDSMVKQGIWCDFMLEKATIVKHMLNNYNNSMILDTDIIIINEIFVDDTKDIGLSPGHIPEKNIQEVGYYNGGYIWFSNINAVDRWIHFTKTKSRYFEQASLENLRDEFSFFEFDDNHNIQSWRFILDKSKEMLFSKYENEVTYNSKPIISIHTHFYLKLMESFNNLIKRLLIACKKTIPLICIDRIEQGGKWIIKIPIQPCKNPFFNHKGDTFRELCVLMVEKHNDIKIVPYEGFHVMLSRQMNVLLYDRPTLEFINKNDPLVKQCSKILIGNGSKEKEVAILEQNNLHAKPFIFWARKPSILEKFIEINNSKSYDERLYNTIFIGNIENSVQSEWRDNKRSWNDVVDKFIITSGSQHVFTQNEYLEHMSNSRFGLSFAGYGCKCNRDIELMALGTVMLRTDGVNVDSYYEPLVEDVHYINVDSKEDILKIVNSVSKERWKIMSKACKEWYIRNCHSSNTFNIWINALF